MLLVVSLPRQEDESAERWLSLSGGGSFGFLVREHEGEDGPAPWDHWFEKMDEAKALSEAYGVPTSEWHAPEGSWHHAPPPAGFDWAEYHELGRRILAGEVTRPEAAEAALHGAIEVARSVAAGDLDPFVGARRIYDWAWQGGAWDESDPSPRLRHLGSEFIQLADALERHLTDKHVERTAWESLVREAALAAVESRVLPDWRDDGGPFPLRQVSMEGPAQPAQ